MDGGCMTPAIGRPNYDAGLFVEAFESTRMRARDIAFTDGLQGAGHLQRCSVVKWNEGTSYPIQSGHGCIGCSGGRASGHTGPFYQHLPSFPGFGIESTGRYGGTVVGY